MTASTIGKIVGVAVVVVAGALAAGRSVPKTPEPPPAQPTLSAPAATSADIAALRQHFDDRFDVQGSRLGDVEQRLAGVEGYMKAQQQAALEKAVAGHAR